MSLYILETEHYDYNEYNGFVIWAIDEVAAREAANDIDTRWPDNSPKVWLDSKLSTCEIIKCDSTSLEVILSSFNAG